MNKTSFFYFPTFNCFDEHCVVADKQLFTNNGFLQRPDKNGSAAAANVNEGRGGEVAAGATSQLKVSNLANLVKSLADSMKQGFSWAI